MNIDNQLPSYKQPQTKTYRNSGDFADLMDKHRPSGDEYYRQHQSELQQSELEFNAVEIAKGKHFIQACAPKLNHDAALIEEKVSVTPVHQTLQTPMHQDVEQQSDTDPHLINAERVIGPAQTLSLPLSQAKPTLELSATVEQQEPEGLSLAYKQELKRHHLFINQDEAELTLNTQDLEPEEAQEYIPLIKNFLKNKGLLLKKLIINGVHHA